MDEEIRTAVGGEEAYVVGGAVRDELLGRPVLDVDVACRSPREAAAAYATARGAAMFLLSERHGAWRVALNGSRTVDFTLLRGSIEEDLGGRDFAINAIAFPLDGGAPVDPFSGRDDLGARSVRAVTEHVFVDDPLRLLRAVRLEDELAFVIEPATERLIVRDRHLVTRPAGERILTELVRLSPSGYERLDDLGLLAELGGTRDGLVRAGADPSPQMLLVSALGKSIDRLPISNETRRFARVLLAASPPEGNSPRDIHRFRRATEPWAVDALRFVGRSDLEGAVLESREAEFPSPLLRGDELDIPPGPEVGRLLARIAEERVAGTIETREQALELVRRERS